MRGDKKGQQMTLGTIIAIVLGIAVLVLLIWGFSSGWNNLWDRISEVGGGSINVDTIKNACVLSCQKGSSYGFCEQVRKVTIEGGLSAKGSCKTFSKEVEFEKGKETKIVSIGIEPCPALC